MHNSSKSVSLARRDGALTRGMCILSCVPAPGNNGKMETFSPVLETPYRERSPRAH